MKNLKQRQEGKKTGFTIIEVVLVLAVAGLIFLVVFAAVPRLQASRRDNQRKRDAEALYTAVIDFIGNTGSPPTGTTTCTSSQVASALAASPTGAFVDYLPLDWSPPEGGSYVAATVSWAALPSTQSEIVYCLGAICNGTGTASTTTGASPDDFVIAMSLERGIYCLD